MILDDSAKQLGDAFSSRDIYRHRPGLATDLIRGLLGGFWLHVTAYDKRPVRGKSLCGRLANPRSRPDDDCDPVIQSKEFLVVHWFLGKKCFATQIRGREGWLAPAVAGGLVSRRAGAS